MMKKNIFCIFSLLAVCSFSHANLILKITADGTELAVGDKTTLHVFGLLEGAASGEGLYDWSVLAGVDNSGIVQASSAVLLQPDPVDSGISGSTPDSLGNLDASAAIQNSATGSDAGVGYTELFNFEIEGISVGQVQYSLTSIFGTVYDFSSGEPLDPDNYTFYDDTEGNVQFNAADSVGMIDVVPEPATLLMLGLGSIVAFRRKK